MEDQKSKQSESNTLGSQNGANTSGSRSDQQHYKNIETSVNSPEHFNDDYEVQQEDEMRSGEAKGEQETQQK